MSTYPFFTPHKYIKKIAELKIVVDIKTIEVQRLYLISKQEGASGKKTRNKHSMGCQTGNFVMRTEDLPCALQIPGA